MPTSLHVEKQCFKFGAPWTVAFKYDDTSCYRNGPERLKGEVGGVPQSTRALDAVGLHEKAGLLMLEAKDFRGHRIENKPRVKDRTQQTTSFESNGRASSIPPNQPQRACALS